jgi:DNA-directed RNA polymerase specialized sigma24 family protein
MDERNALGRLPETYRRVLWLRSEGVDEGGLASALGVEREAVGPLLRLAEEKLANLLQEERIRRARRGDHLCGS